jgi:nicotinamide-nucleotide amidase
VVVLEDILQLARQRDVWLATAESCTGGLVAAALTEVAGSSDVMAGGFVTYANAMKQQLVAVSSTSLHAYGAVCEQVACEMAQGACVAVQQFMGDGRGVLAVAVTGIAGPTGGSPEKPVGTVHLATCWLQGDAQPVFVHHACQFTGSRTEIRSQAVQHALEMLLAVLK